MNNLLDYDGKGPIHNFAQLLSLPISDRAFLTSLARSLKHSV